MLSPIPIILLLSSVIPPSLAQNSSIQPVCDKNVIPAVINSSLAKQGPVCGFPLATHLNFTQCCALNQPIYYTDTCTQYCLVNKNQTADFPECARLVARGQNLTLGIAGCQLSAAGRIGVMSLEGVVLGAAFLGLLFAF